MKKVLIITNLLSLVAAVYFGIRAFDKTCKPVVDNSRCSDCMDYNNVGTASGKLDMNLVKTMAYNYQTSVSDSATRSVWFDLSTLKRFIWQIEHLSCKCPDSLGVRVYFAKYPVDYAWTNIFTNDLQSFRSSVVAKYNPTNNQKNPYQHINTIFMVPTIWDGTKNVDFDPADPLGCSFKGYNETKFGKNEVRMVKNEFISSGMVPSFYSNQMNKSITALMSQNHGEACPPIPPNKEKCPDEGAYFDY